MSGSGWAKRRTKAVEEDEEGDALDANNEPGRKARTERLMI